ncbi:alpha-E domain-containing protein [Cellvibrio sp. pealriver]|uniref:alpha-E domain-containing protein n=1 Tax=Cellvibrio sp. pealriver TaxID=1622269 RepID=UPI00066FE21E|nr:alpha-E domain-containing protein [Cellvibrio sp. pealriver]
MLSRVAERIYWLGRYMERCENTARLVNVNSNLLLDLPSGVRVGWGSLIDISGTGSYFKKDTLSADEKTVVHFMLADKDNPASLINSLSFARENSRITREIMPMEAWELINDLYHYIRDRAEKVTSRRDRSIMLLHVISSVQQFTGLLAGCMSHNNAYDLIRIGRNLERADMSTRIVDVGLVNLLPHLSIGGTEVLEPYDNILWMSVLRSLSAYQMYRQHVRDRVNANAVVSFLLQNEDFPRAVSHCLKQLEQCLWALPNSEKVLAAIVNIQHKLDEADLDRLLQSGLHEYIDELQLEIGNLHFKIAETWFLPSVMVQSQEQKSA